VLHSFDVDRLSRQVRSDTVVWNECLKVDLRSTLKKMTYSSGYRFTKELSQTLRLRNTTRNNS